MALQLIILLTSLEPNHLAGELPGTCVDEPFECFMEHENGLGKLLLEIISTGVEVNETYPYISRIIVELRTLLFGFGIDIQQLKKLTITDEPKTVLITVE